MSRLLTTGVIGVIGGSKPFEFTINTGNTSTGSTTSTQFKLPLDFYGIYDMTVDWGDGSFDKITAYDQLETTHEYGVEGIYTISITGKLNGWTFQNTGDKLKMLDIINWGCFEKTILGDQSSAYMFYGCSNLTISATDAPKLARSLLQAFRDCTSLDSDIGHWDMSQVTIIASMFYGCSVFNNGGSDSINNWDTSNMLHIGAAFRDCLVFNQPLNNWDVSNVINFSETFRNADSFNQDIGSWDVSSGTAFTYMFFINNGFNNGGSPNINNWRFNTTANISFESMFQGATAFNQPIGDWNVGRATFMRGMFLGASSFNQDIGLWDVSNVTNMNSMFYNATNFNQNLSAWNVGSVTDMSFMFRSAQAFNNGGSADINNWDVSNVTNMNSMFMLADVFNQPLNLWNTGSVTNMSSMFQSASVFNQNIGSWNTGAVTNMASMFLVASVFNNGGSPDINNWNVSNVTTMQSMFSRAFVFNQPIGLWNTISVTTMRDMFYFAEAFNQDIGSWNTSNVTTMQSMFLVASSFNQDISTWDVSKVTNMYQMFYQATAFNQDISSWNVGASLDFNGFLQFAPNYSTTNQDLLYNGWINYELQPNEPIDFTANYTAAAVEGRALLTRPYTTIAVSNVANNGSGLIRVTTSTAHGLTTGNKCFLKDITGTTEANGLATVTVIDATTFDIDGSTFTNAYVSGGTVITGYGWTITDGGLI